jgi:2'-5' RNA ligase
MAKILKFNELISEKKSGFVYEYGCVMVSLDIPNWKKDVLSLIEKEDLFEGDSYGLETESHVTALYGIYDSIDMEDVKSAIKEFSFDKNYLELKNITLFEKENYDVVKFDIEDKQDILNSFHSFLKETFPNSDTYPEYHPHATIAYVKKGRGVKYIQELEKPIITKINQIMYSYPVNNGKSTDKIYIDLK